MKKLRMLLIMPFCLIGCISTPEQNAASKITDNEALVKQYFQHFNNHDWSKMAGMYKDTVLFKDPSMGNGIVSQTRAQIMEKYNMLQQAIPDVHDSVIQTYKAGPNNIVVEFISKGTAPDQSKFELPICTIFTIENGMITKDFTYYDNFEEPGK